MVLIGALLVALGVGAIYWPAGLVVAGAELVAAALFLIDVE